MSSMFAACVALLCSCFVVESVRRRLNMFPLRLFAVPCIHSQSMNACTCHCAACVALLCLCFVVESVRRRLNMFPLRSSAMHPIIIAFHECSNGSRQGCGRVSGRRRCGCRCCCGRCRGRDRGWVVVVLAVCVVLVLMLMLVLVLVL